MTYTQRWLGLCLASTLTALFNGSAGAQCLPDTPEAPLAGPNGSQFGLAVALADSGTGGVRRAAVGAPQDALSGHTSAGAVYVYLQSAAGWQLEAVLTASDAAPGEQFGTAVALSADGARLFVGAPFDSDLGFGSGSVYVFERTGSLWSETVKLSASNGVANAHFGAALSIGADGSRFAVGTDGSSLIGDRIYVFRSSGSTWVEEAILSSAGVFSVYSFGASLDLSSDAAWLVGGEPRYDPGWGDHSGSFTVFSRIGNTWSQAGFYDHLTDFQDFGRAVAISDDGNRVLVGNPAAVFQLSGRVHEFERDANTPQGWSPVNIPVPTGVASTDLFGQSLSVNTAFTRMLVGAPGDDEAGSEAGAAYLYDFDDVLGWVEIEKLLPASSSAMGRAGMSVALAAETTGAALVGSFGNDQVNVYGEPQTQIFCTAKRSASGCVPTIDFAGTPSTTAGPFFVTVRQVPNSKTGLFFYGTNGAASIPFFGGTLCVTPPLKRTALQNAGGSSPPGFDCSGAFAFAMNALAQAGVDPEISPGTSAAGQFWYRDPSHPDGTGVGLSDAVEFTFCE